MSKFFFLLIGLAAMGTALLQPQDTSPEGLRAGIRAIMEKHGYVPSGQTDMGALTIARFSSPACGDVRVLPVSIQFQETALLRNSANDRRMFVYRGRVWTNVPPDRAVLSHLTEKFRQLTRLRPDPAIDTMLVVITPKTCGVPGIDWSAFWSAAAI